MLTKAGIGHEWISRREVLLSKEEWDELKDREFWKDLDFGWQIIVYKSDGERLVSAIEGWGTYGAEADKIEIMGLLSPEEGDGPHDVVGWLTAENVFARIQHWRNKHEREN